MSWRTVGAVVLVLAAASAAASAGSNDYELTLLSTPTTWLETNANDVNDSGRIVGEGWRRVGGPWYVSAAMWEDADSDPTTLDLLNGDRDARALAINNTGKACGYSAVHWYFGPYKAVIWDKDGTVTDMHPGFGTSRTSSQMLDLNQYGDATGIAFNPAVARAFVTPHGDDSYLLDLDTDTYAQSWPYEINKGGEVVGFVRYTTASRTRAAYWSDDNEMVDLQDELEDWLGESLWASKAWHISDKGEVGGVAVWFDAGVVTVKPWIWTDDDGFTLVDMDGTPNAAVVGGGGKAMVGLVDGYAEQWFNSEADGAVWVRGNHRGETTWNLHVIAPPSGYETMTATSANTSGSVVGSTYDRDASSQYIRAWFAKR